MVGWAMNNAHSIKPHVPAQRVVNRVGLLTGKHHFGTQNMMQKLLENEGIKIKQDKIHDFNKYFWDPTEELLRTIINALLIDYLCISIKKINDYKRTSYRCIEEC